MMMISDGAKIWNNSSSVLFPKQNCFCWKSFWHQNKPSIRFTVFVEQREIGRQELIEIEEKLNGHSRAWAQIWGSGEDHDHTSRIMTGKVTHSENIADLYLMYKDHKSGDKTIPTATGHSSNKRGLSNAVSEVLEAINNSEKARYNTISSEDMMARMVEYNNRVHSETRKWKETRISKMRCQECQIMQNIDCEYTEDHPWDNIIL